MIQEFIFPVPPSLNQIINSARANRYKAAAEKKRLTEECAAIAVGRKKFPDKIWVEAYFYLKRRRDIDNCLLKFALDGLQEAGIIQNDKLVQSPVILWVETVKADPKLRLLVSDRLIFRGENID